MKSKEKRKIIIGIILIAILVTIYVIYNIYTNQIISYASNDKILTETPRISNAKKVNIENIIMENQNYNIEQIRTEEVELEYITEYRNNNTLSKGTMQVVQEGRTGLQQVTIKITYNENGEMYEEQINSIITKAAVKKIVEIGTSNSK